MINLSRHTQRLQQFYAQADAHYFHRVDAIDRKVLALMDCVDMVFNTEPFLHKIHRQITLGEIACALSHIRCWQKIADNPQLEAHHFAMVAEDDIELCPQFAQILQQVLNVLPQYPDKRIVLLQKTQSILSGFHFYQGEATSFNLLSDDTGIILENDGAALYLIRKDKAIELVHHLEQHKPHWLADHFGEFCSLHQVCLLEPHLARVKMEIASDLEAFRQVERMQARQRGVVVG